MARRGQHGRKRPGEALCSRDMTVSRLMANYSRSKGGIAEAVEERLQDEMNKRTRDFQVSSSIGMKEVLEKEVHACRMDQLEECDRKVATRRRAGYTRQ